MNNLTDLKEQLQEDIITYFAARVWVVTNSGHARPDGVNINELCQIIVDRVTELQDNEDHPDGAITSGDKKLLAYLAKAENKEKESCAY